MSTLKDVLVPDIGDFKDVEIIDILIKPGDSIQPEDPLITLESDKATMDVPSPEAGIVQELLAQPLTALPEPLGPPGLQQTRWPGSA